MDYIRLRHELMYAAWDEDAGLWRLRIRRTCHEEAMTVAEFDDTADVLILGVGWLSRPRWPDIPGLRGFQGRLLHTALWDVADTDGAQHNHGVPQTWRDKAVGVIGNVTPFLHSLSSLNDLCPLDSTCARVHQEYRSSRHSSPRLARS
jgi:cation diffusion facilitator CzcD-associated flavoprotein CzcO